MKGSFISHSSPSSRRKEKRSASIYPRTYQGTQAMKLTPELQTRVEECAKLTGRTVEAEINRLVGLGLTFDPPERWAADSECGQQQALS